MSSARAASGAASIAVREIELEVVRRGAGVPLLFLYGPQIIGSNSPIHDLQCKHAEWVAPSHSGFGVSKLPDGFETLSAAYRQDSGNVKPILVSFSYYIGSIPGVRLAYLDY